MRFDMEQQKWALLASSCVLYFKNGQNDSIEVSLIEDVMGLSMEREALQAIERYCKKRLKLSDEQIRVGNAEKLKAREMFFSESSRVKVKQGHVKECENSVSVVPEKTVYLIKDKVNGAIKIGLSRNLESRLLQLKTANASIEVLDFFNGMRSDEKYLHDVFTKAGKRIGGEWFSLDNDDVSFIKKYFTEKSL